MPSRTRAGDPSRPQREAGDTLWEHLHRRSLLLETADGRSIRPVLVFDQFEELFAIGQVERRHALASRAISSRSWPTSSRTAPEALEQRLEDSPELVKHFFFDDRDYRMLVCLREDYLPHLESLRRSVPSIAENRMRLTRMDGARALEAVSNPAGDLITREVGRQVVRFVAGGRMRPADASIPLRRTTDWLSWRSNPRS